MSFTSKVIVKVANYSGSKDKPATADKNGLMPVILLPVAGTIPNRMVLSGTVAEKEGFIAGTTYLAQCRELEEDDTYGRRFSFMILGEPSMIELLQLEAVLGEGKVFDAVGSATTAETKADVKDEVETGFKEQV